jgi:hypothetical protein
MPEHFETIHYHDATYYASKGPFGFRIKTPNPPSLALTTNYRSNATGVSGTTVTLSNASDFASSGSVIISSTVANAVSEDAQVMSYIGKSGNDLTGCANVTGDPLAFIAITTRAARQYLIADLAADGTHYRKVVSHDVDAKTITTNRAGEGGGVFSDGTLITVDGRVYTVGTFTVGGAEYEDETTITHTSSTLIRAGMNVTGSGISGDAIIDSVTDATHFELTIATYGGLKTGQTLTIGADGGEVITIDEEPAAEIAVGLPISFGSDGTLHSAITIDSENTGHYTVQGGQSDSGDNNTKTMLNHFWPSGSRGGPLVSRLDGYAYVSSSWDYPREYTYDGPIWSDGDDDGSYTVSSGISKSSYDGISNPTRPRPFGYRFGLRQPYNKPQWSMYGLRALRESAVTATNASVGYQHGPLVHHEGQTWTYAGGTAGVSNPSIANAYAGIMERQTNFSGMLGVDKPEWQVRYSDGMRFTRPFGCPVRTLRNGSSVLRDWWGDADGKGLDTIEKAVKYYIVDWWGNTRGEDIRRFPVRSFGIRPSWDAGDAYEYDRTNNRTPYERLHNNGKPLVNMKGLLNAAGTALSITGTVPRFGGRLNNTNNNDATTLVDVFMPTNAQRVGDMGNGRGVRYPTAFNEDILTALSEPIRTTGLVLSHHTAEPILKGGFIRARNDILQASEVPRGISARLEIAEDGLLKPEAVVSDRVENIVGDSPHKDAISRSSPRIGLDTENLEGVDTNQIIINTEAHSLHTDRNVGQRVVLQGGFTTGSQTLGDYDLTALTFAGQPQGGALRMSHTSNFNPLGGTYLAETRNYLSPIDDSNWGGIPSSGMALWLKADALDLDDGDAVTAWTDVSGNEHTFVQATASAQPTYRASDSDFNNMPVVDCDGGDKLVGTFSADLNTNQMTLIVVACSDTDDGSYQGIIESRSSSPVARSGWNLYAKWSGADQWGFWYGSNTGWGQLYPASHNMTAGSPDIITAIISGGDGAGATATETLRINGNQENQKSEAFWKSTADGGTVGNVPTPYYLNGQIAEIIQYNRALSTTEIQQVEGYLSKKYAIASTSTWKSSNPYLTDNNGDTRGNVVDKKVTYMMRPVRMMDKQHIEMFRSNLNLDASAPQYGSNYFSATAGGKYGLYLYHVDNGRATGGSYIRATNPDTNPPYAPAYFMDISASDSVPMSTGPSIKGTGVTGFDTASIDNEVTRVIISENTLQHYRSDAPRRKTFITVPPSVMKGGIMTFPPQVRVIRKDYKIEPRFSQSLHPKGHKGDVDFNTTDHSGDGS